MWRAVALVLALLVVMAYLSLFLAWNAKLQPVVTWQLGAQYTQELPIGLLFIAGVLVGAVAMALALTGPWNALKAGENHQRTLLDRAKAKLKTQQDQIAKLKAKAAEEAEPAPEAEEEEKGGPSPEAKADAEDPEVI